MPSSDPSNDPSDPVNEPSVGPDAGPDDLGLLAPVRAGSAVEAATGDRAFLQGLLDAEAALTRAQAALGEAPAGAAEAVTAAARADRFDLRDLALRARSGGNPVIPLVGDLTAAVREADPDAAAYVHRGATSQDIQDTAVMLVARRAVAPVLADLERTASALYGLADAHRDTVMPGRTLTQHAVPTTFGLKAAGWRSLVLDAYERLAAVRLPAQLGGAAGTLAAFCALSETFPPEQGPRLIAAYAAETGLAEPLLPWHTLRTPVADLATALALTTGALGKIAADVLLLSRTECGEVAEGSGGGSSAMPHKSNPVRSTLIAAAARQAPGLAVPLLGSLAAEDERPAGAWHAEWQPLRELLRLAGGAAAQAAELAEGLRVFPDRMRADLMRTKGLMAAERISAALAPVLGRAAAQAALTRASRAAVGRDVTLAEALRADPEVSGALPADELTALADPAGYTGSAAVLTDRALGRPGPGTPSRPGPAA